jgi:hypothetical protein
MSRERTWWAFLLPSCAVAWVPAPTEPKALEVLRRTCYDGAPVHRWPLLAVRVCTREGLVHVVG